MIDGTTFPLECFSQLARERVNRALEAYMNLDSNCPDSLREAMRYSLLAPGKRLRPMLVLLASEACQGSADAAMPAACAVEMVHTYSLIHDDLPAMDDDDMRRGRPTCHKAFGEAEAILAGDALLTLAFEVLAREVLPPAVAAECCAVLAGAAGPCGMVGGQAADMAGDFAEAEFSAGELHALEAIHRRKTGALFLASLEMGALVAAASELQLKCLRDFGQKLGLAFQITDDLLDVRGDAAAMGKRTGKDSGRGKLTFPGILGVAQSERQAEVLIHDACEALAPLVPHATGLQALAHYVLERKH